MADFVQHGVKIVGMKIKRGEIMYKKIRLWLCKNLSWHSYNYFDGFDGCSATATCKICGFKGMVDSQGGLF